MPTQSLELARDSLGGPVLVLFTVFSEPSSVGSANQISERMNSFANLLERKRMESYSGGNT